MRKTFICSLVILALCTATFARGKDKEKRLKTAEPNPAFDKVVDGVIAREAENEKALRSYTPIVETYIQKMTLDDVVGARPIGDEYFLSRVGYSKVVDDRSMLASMGMSKKMIKEARKKVTHSFGFRPEGFASQAILDSRSFDRAHYEFEFVGREFVGDLRCLMIDVTPKEHSGNGRFIGRIWVEDKDLNIVRFDGTYIPQRRDGLYLHFNTWRLNMQPGIWLPAYIYSEESDLHTGLRKHLRFKAETRLWAYNVGREHEQSTFTQVVVDTNEKVADQSDEKHDQTPIAAQRSWEREAEDNALDRMERGGILAKRGDVDQVLTTVLNNLIITNNLSIDPEVRARVLLTTPVESFAVGHTIVLSRGLLDVLPDEANLAGVLAGELAHIVLGHTIDTKYAFDDRLIFSDEATLRRMQFTRNPLEQAEADKKALEILQNSPYKDKLDSIGLFLRQLQERSTVLTHLVQARIGNPMLLKDNQLRLSPLLAQAPKIEPTKLDQIAALQLGGRIKVDPWNNHIELTKAKPTPVLHTSEKMPLELTPVYPYLTRYGTAPAVQPATAPPTTRPDDAAPAAETPAATPAEPAKPQPEAAKTSSVESTQL